MPANDIEIRSAQAGDSEQLWPLVENFAFSYRPDRSAFERALADLLDRSDTLVLVAVTSAEALIGYLLGSFHGTFFANGPVAWIEELMVSEPLRGMGVATCPPLRSDRMQVAESISSWWTDMGRTASPPPPIGPSPPQRALTTDTGHGAGNVHLAKLAAETGLEITACRSHTPRLARHRRRLQRLINHAGRPSLRAA
jgi:hypothetical protein